jgi:hypothetical protein
MGKDTVTMLCVSRYFKGEDFLKAAKADGNRVFLLTSDKLKNDPWPWESIDETFYMHEDEHGKWNMDHLIDGLAYKMRDTKFDVFVALDDFDVEHVAMLREYFRIPGMGDTTARYFRDKLAMRLKAREEGIPVPAFTALFHDEDIHRFTQTVPAPWLVKPRMQASATGIKKVYNAEELWAHLHHLGSHRHQYLLERFAPGAVYHVDALTFDGKVQFAKVSQYVDTPFEVAHGGGIFKSVTVEEGSKDDKALKKLNEKVMKGFGMQYSASHTEFIRCNEDGEYYFLETSSRVGGAHLSDMVEAATGLNLWAEWARLEAARFLGKNYTVPKTRKDHAGIIVSLSRYAEPDYSRFNEKEIAWHLHKKHHIGLIVRSESHKRVHELLENYTHQIKEEYHASLPAPDKPTS